MLAGAIGETAGVLRQRIVAIAADRLEAAETDIELAHGSAHVRGTPALKVSLAEIAHLAYFSPHALPDGVPPGLEASGRFSPKARSNWANATHVCTCEIDVATGQVELLRYIVSEDCGPMINPNVVEGQIAGGTVQGIGGALLEHAATTTTAIPVHHLRRLPAPDSDRLPEIEYGPRDAGTDAGGHKGVGRRPAIGAPPAVVKRSTMRCHRSAYPDAPAPTPARMSKRSIHAGHGLSVSEAAGPGGGGEASKRASTVRPVERSSNMVKSSMFRVIT